MYHLLLRFIINPPMSAWGYIYQDRLDCDFDEGVEQVCVNDAARF